MSHRLFFITSTTKDPDKKFEECLDSLEMDVEGKLVETLTLQGKYILSMSFKMQDANKSRRLQTIRAPLEGIYFGVDRQLYVS